MRTLYNFSGLELTVEGLDSDAQLSCCLLRAGMIDMMHPAEQKEGILTGRRGALLLAPFLLKCSCGNWTLDGGRVLRKGKQRKSPECPDAPGSLWLFTSTLLFMWQS